MQGAVAEAKGVRLEVTGPSRVIRSDGVLLRRMLMNLVSNAVKFTSSGEIRVEVRDVDGEVELSVSDTGCGMSAERLQEVTLEYIRISPGVDGTEGGLGLGLSIVKQGCRLLGHRLEISSRQGLGSRFTLRLGPAVATLEPRPLAHADIGGSAIAVVENDPLVLQSVVAMLTTWGATPVVGDGVGELQRALADEGRLPDILIADLHLSDGEDGLEAIAALRAALAEQDLPAIIVTGDLDPAIQTQAAQQNVRVAYKPLRPERLRRLIAQVLQERREATDARA